MSERSNSSGRSSMTVLLLALRILVLFVVVGFTSIAAITLFSDGYWQLALMLVIIGVFNVIVFLHPDTEALRWLSPGLSLFLVFVLYPLISTVIFAFTNYGTSNSLTKQQVIKQFEQRRYLPEGGNSYQYTLYYSEAEDSYALWLVAEDGSTLFVGQDTQLTVADDEAKNLNAVGVPAQIGDYVPLSRGDAARSLSKFADGTTWGVAPHVVEMSRSKFGVAVELEPRYVYDASLDTITDKQTGVNYIADDTRGFFVNSDNTDERIPVGYQVGIGFDNFRRFLVSPALRGPIVSILIWNFAFAFLSVLFAFTVGLVAALTFNGNGMMERIIKTGLILPWAIPSTITILIWNGLLNPLNGVYAHAIANIATLLGHPQTVGWPPIYSDPNWSRAALLVLNTWFAFPYFMLICSGALQAIPTDLYEAAQLDGANLWQRFWNMTMPLLLLTIGPLLIGSFAVNFNSFEIIYLFNGGGPPIVGATTPAGHTDLLISYVYKLSFAGGGGRQEFGYAAAITIIIFILLAGITAYNLRFMNIWEETGRNV